MKRCHGCNEAERRWKDTKGRDQVNLDPILGLCVTCLAAYVREARVPARAPFDARKAAANDGARE